MHIETVTIDRIDWVSRETFKWNRHTHLSFRLPGGTPQTWTIPGWPEVQEGMTVTAVLKQPLTARRSNQVLGWKSRADGSLAFVAVGGMAVFYTVFSFLAGTLFLRAYLDPAERSSLFSLVPSIMFLMLGVLGLYTIRSRRRILRILRLLP